MLVVDDAGLVPAENAQPVICFMFDGETLTSLKTDSNIGTTISNTFLDVEPFSYDDTSNNTVNVMQQIWAFSFVDDMTIDMDTGNSH